MDIQKETATPRILITLLVVPFLVSSCAAPTTNRNASSTNATSPVNTAPEVPVIEFRYGENITTLTFTEAEMDLIERQTEAGNSKAAEAYIMGKLAAGGKKCCEPRRRLDLCTWHCCDAAIVRTCNKKLVAALDRFGN